MDIVVAVYDDWGIGADGTQPIALAADRKFFREITKGAAVIVGRRTVADFPGGKPLPGRANIMLTKTVREQPGFEVASSPEAALAIAKGNEKVMVIGGGSIYRQMLPMCDRAYVTKVHTCPASDTFFPNLDEDGDWILSEILQSGEENGIAYEMCLYTKKVALSDETADHQSVINEFLNTPLDCSDSLFRRFSALPNAISGTGDQPLQRYVYIPGTRKDRVVLVAHADTVWDKAYKKPYSGAPLVAFDNGIFFSGNPTCGIGADDRAGCAMLWLLRDCGHSILLVDGEEHGKRGAWYLRKSNPKLYRTLNKHCYMIELDAKGTDHCLFSQVDNTDQFKAFIESNLGVTAGTEKGGTDVQVLCRNVCGVNLGIGYSNCHTPKEQLILSQWDNTLTKLEAFLQQPQSRYSTKFLSPFTGFCKRCTGKVKKLLKR